MEFRQKTFVIFSEEEYEEVQNLLLSKNYKWIHGGATNPLTPLSGGGYLDFTQGTIMMSRLKKEHMKDPRVVRETRKRKLKRILKYDL